ncbi:MAG: DUF177 domain-containing protein [Dehalococcoidales bacterium]|nr:DUF177 domain-containing protein [Dehalococcoidales bacterium]
MQINVSGLLESSIGATRDYRLSGVINIAGSDRVVEGEVLLVRTNRGILVRAKLNTEVELGCSRCLKLFGYPLRLNIEEEYLPVADDAEGFTIDERHILDLTEAVRQYALLAIPMKPLCREDCRGLCPICGHDLNQGPCGCSS